MAQLGMRIGSRTIKRDIPLLITFFAGMLMLADWHISLDFTKTTVDFIRTNTVVLTSFTLGLGAINLYRRFGTNLRNDLRRKNYTIDTALCVWLIIVLTAFLVTGFFLPTQYNSLYNVIYLPVSLASPTIWYIAPACYRFLRVKSRDSALITIGGFIGIMASTPLWMSFTPWVTDIDGWLAKFVTAPVYSGFWIGIGLGSIGVSIRTILGIETRYLGALLEEEKA